MSQLYIPQGRIPDFIICHTDEGKHLFCTDVLRVFLQISEASWSLSQHSDQKLSLAEGGPQTIPGGSLMHLRGQLQRMLCNDTLALNMSVRPAEGAPSVTRRRCAKIMQGLSYVILLPIFELDVQTI